MRLCHFPNQFYDWNLFVFNSVNLTLVSCFIRAFVFSIFFHFAPPTQLPQRSIAQCLNSSLDLKLVWMIWFLFFLFFLFSFLSFVQYLASDTSNWTIIWFAIWWCTARFASGNAWRCRDYEYLRCNFCFLLFFFIAFQILHSQNIIMILWKC